MLRIGTKLILSEAELERYKKLILSKYPCKEEVAYRKKIEEQKKIIEDQGHELYNQNKTIEFLKSELDKKKEPVKTSTIKIDDIAPLTTINTHPSREEVCDMINKSLEEAYQNRKKKDEEALANTREYIDLKAENEMLKKVVAGNNTAEEIVIDQETDKRSMHINNKHQNIKKDEEDNTRIERELRKCKYCGDLSYVKQKYIDLKASYDNLLDEQRSLKCNDEKLNEAKLIIDALQKENAALKAQLSDYEAHKCHCDTEKTIKLSGDIEELADSVYEMGTFENDASKKFIVLDGINYQVSTKLYYNFGKYILHLRELAKDYISTYKDDDNDEE